MPWGDRLVGRTDRKRVASSNGRPMSCNPIGKLSSEKPQGTLMAGNPVTLAGYPWWIRRRASPGHRRRTG